MTTVITYSRTQSATYVSDNIIKSLKDIIRLAGLNPENLVDRTESLSRALNTWLGTGHLTKVTLEIYDPNTDKLVQNWDIDVRYDWSAGNGSFYTDTEQLRWAIKKSGLPPNTAKYRVLLYTKNGRPDVEGWSSTKARSTDGMVRQSLGATIEHNGLGASTSYWRHAS